MDFERQKPVSDEYRENWERVYATYDHGRTWYNSNKDIQAGLGRTYPNGCPILSEGERDNA